MPHNILSDTDLFGIRIFLLHLFFSTRFNTLHLRKEPVQHLL